MRLVERSEWTAPAILQSDEVDDELRRAAQHFDVTDTSARQRVFEFQPLQMHPAVVDELRAVFQQKCAFCESPVGLERPWVVHRFRPSQEAVGVAGDVSRPHYWWLTYSWLNLYLACETCSMSASAQFPVRGARGRIGSSLSQVRKTERPLLLDPCRDRPERHLEYSQDGFYLPRSARGDATIEAFRLNRPDLLEARRVATQEALEAVTSIADRRDSRTLQSLLPQERAYWGAVRAVLIDYATRSGIPVPRGSLLDADVGDRSAVGYVVAKPSPQVEPLVLRSLRLQDVRGVQSLDLDFARKRRAPWTMLLGENGHGKSTVLRAAALILMGQAARDRLAINANDWIRTGADAGEIEAWVEGERESRRLRFSRTGAMIYSGDDTPAAMAAYGAGRLPPPEDQPSLPRRYRVRPRIENLFDPHVPMMPATGWLLSLDEPDFAYAARAVRRLLLEPDSTTLHQLNDQVILDRGDSRISLELLSDGYRATLSLATDLMSAFLMRFGSLDAAKGLVLVDELSAHLHPRWQMKIVPAFRAAFPQLQVIATTHDPLSLRGLDAGEVVVLKRRPSDRRIYRLADDEVPPTRGLRVDELLTSEIFGLNSTVDDEVEDLYDRYYALLARRSTEGRTDEVELSAIKKRLDGLRQFGTTRRERLALEAADQYLAEEQETVDPDDRAVISDELRSRLRAIWSGEQ